SSRRRHTRFDCDWSSDVCSSDLDTSTVISDGYDTTNIRGAASTDGVTLWTSGGSGSGSGGIRTLQFGNSTGISTQLNATSRQDRSEERRVGKELRSRLPVMQDRP